MQEEMGALLQLLESRARDNWRMSFEQVEELDVTVAPKDQEIAN